MKSEEETYADSKISKVNTIRTPIWRKLYKKDENKELKLKTAKKGKKAQFFDKDVIDVLLTSVASMVGNAALIASKAAHTSSVVGVFLPDAMNEAN